jgi:hypothetical protein
LAERARLGAAAYAAPLKAEQAEVEASLAETRAILDTVKRRRVAGAFMLADGRKMHCWPAPGTAGNPGVALAWLDAARKFGAVLVADGDTLHLVEPKRGLSAGLIADLRREASGIVAALRGEHHARTGD